jgi:mono/diheme cytochrome c family protein
MIAGRRAQTIAAVSAAALSLLAVACGDDGDDETTAADTGAETATAPPGADAEQPLTAAEERGRTLFVENCGSCHTLGAAGTTGQIGPNLDEALVDEADVRRAIEVGGRGSGNMPPKLVTGPDAEDVAAFVAANGPGP